MGHFQAVTAAEFSTVVRDFPWTRKVTEVQLDYMTSPVGARFWRDENGRVTADCADIQRRLCSGAAVAATA